MTVLITIAALFAVQIYAPAFAGAWPRMSGGGHVAFKRAVLPEMPEFPFPSKPVKLKPAAANFVVNIFCFGKTSKKRPRPRYRTNIKSLQTRFVSALACHLAKRLAVCIRRDTAAAAQIFHHHTHTKTHNAEGPASTRQDGGGLTFTIADRLSWKRYHLAQSLAVTQFNGRSSGYGRTIMKFTWAMPVKYRSAGSVKFMKIATNPMPAATAMWQSAFRRPTTNLACGFCAAKCRCRQTQHISQLPPGCWVVFSLTAL